MNSRTAELHRLFALLADRAGGEPQAVEEIEEASRLLRDHPHVDEGSFERAAAAIHLSLLPAHLEPLPDRLRERLSEQAREHLRDRFDRPARSSGNLLRWRSFGLTMAVAAALVLTTLALLREVEPPALHDEVARAEDLITVPWTVTGDALTGHRGAIGVRGTVSWSSALGTGLMRFDGLPANDPTKGQYQLWIFDRDRPDEYPVDGGVFDSPGGAFTVPIDAKLAVEQPTLFALTYERPGGVVVSTRERLLLTASPD